VVVNKVDKPGANPDKVINAAFDLFDKLGATDEQLDFPWSTPPASTAGRRWKRASPVPSGARTCRPCSTPSSNVPSVQGDPAPPAAADLGAGLLHLRGPHRRGPHQPGHAQARSDVL
jgi:GTP-binding protein